MANPEHLAILKQGVKAWNEWRKKDVCSPADVSEAVLAETDLSFIDFHGTNLSKVDFSQAILVGADFAGELQGRVVNRGWAGPEQHQGCTLDGANLTGADLSGASLCFASLRSANLKSARLFGSNLDRTDLTDANLSQSDLYGALLSDTWLVGARLVNADLVWADLTIVHLDNADLTDATIGMTTFVNVDLSRVKGLDKIKHQSESSIGIDTIYKSRGNIPEVFLRGCGVPESLITFMHSLTAKAFDFYSCFISHSAKDKHFCERLHADLQAKGVRVWYFPEDAKWGETVWGEIDRSINVYDKLVVVCSENSLRSGPVNREIERALKREDTERKGILFPIRIDDYIFDKWEHERKADVVRKVVGDFSGWDKDAAKYDKAFDKLLKGLQAA